MPPAKERLESRIKVKNTLKNIWCDTFENIHLQKQFKSGFKTSFLRTLFKVFRPKILNFITYFTLTEMKNASKPI